MSTLKRTPFYPLQAERGARFVPFAGYELPVQFEGLIAEHVAVRTGVGIFDVSHMGEVVIEGPQALDAVQWLVTNNVDVDNGKAVYCMMCREDGGVVDDLIVYRETKDRFFLCINGACREKDVGHIRTEAKKFNARVHDLSDDYSQVALQGPKADLLMSRITGHPVGKMASFTFADAEVAGVPGIRIARTGYTGESGVELYVKNAGATTVWRGIMEAGKDLGLALCGLGCRDTLRLEMKYPLYGNDLDLDHNPIEAQLGWAVKLKKDFLGKPVLEAMKAKGPIRKWVGFKMLERGIPRHGYEIQKAGKGVGVVTSGTHSPSLNEPIGAGYVPAELSSIGSEFEVIIRGKPVLARVVETPFYKREA